MDFKKGNPILWIARLILVVGSSLLLIYVVGFYLIFSLSHLPSVATRKANEYLEGFTKPTNRFRIESMDYSIYYSENVNDDSILCQVHFFKEQRSTKANNIIFEYSNNKLAIEANGEIGNISVDGITKEEFKRSYLNVDCISIKDLKADKTRWNSFPNPFSSNSSFGMNIYYKAPKDKITVDIPLINRSFSFEIENIYNSYKSGFKDEIEDVFIASLKQLDDNYLLCMIF